MGRQLKEQSIPKCIILSIFTCGIYNLFWIARLQNDLNELTGDHSTSGEKVVLLNIFTCGIYGIFWAYKFGQRLDELNERRGNLRKNNSILFLALICFSNLISIIVLVFSAINAANAANNAAMGRTNSANISFSPLSIVSSAITLTLYSIMQDQLNKLYER